MSNKRSSLRPLDGARFCSFRIRKRTGKHQLAWFPALNGRIADKSGLIREFGCSWAISWNANQIPPPLRKFAWGRWNRTSKSAPRPDYVFLHKLPALQRSQKTCPLGAFNSFKTLCPQPVSMRRTCFIRRRCTVSPRQDSISRRFDGIQGLGQGVNPWIARLPAPGRPYEPPFGLGHGVGGRE